MGIVPALKEQVSKAVFHKGHIAKVTTYISEPLWDAFCDERLVSDLDGIKIDLSVFGTTTVVFSSDKMVSFSK